jgi:hypothetical protein
MGEPVLRLLISEIAYRATAKILVSYHPSRITAVAEPLVDFILGIVIALENKQPLSPISTDNFVVWELWNKILDEIEKEIPAVKHIEVLGPKATRSERKRTVTVMAGPQGKQPLPTLI